jgi:hypothetical protein
MSRFVFGLVAVGIVTGAVGFGSISGVPESAAFAAKVLSGLCVLLLVAVLIAHAGPKSQAPKRPMRERRTPSRERLPP